MYILQNTHPCRQWILRHISKLHHSEGHASRHLQVVCDPQNTHSGYLMHFNHHRVLHVLPCCIGFTLLPCDIGFIQTKPFVVLVESYRLCVTLKTLTQLPSGYRRYSQPSNHHGIQSTLTSLLEAMCYLQNTPQPRGTSSNVKCSINS